MARWVFYIVSPLAVLALWEAASRLGWWDARFFPPPSAVFVHLFTVTIDEGLPGDIVASLRRIFFGFTLGAASGMVCGVAMGLNATAHRLFYPLVAMAYPVPKIAILPLILLIFGIGEVSKIVIIAIGAFFLVLMSTLHGVVSLERIHWDVPKVFGLSRWQRLRFVVIPGSLPATFTGLRLALGYSLVLIVATEFSGASGVDSGIGYLIRQAWDMFSVKSMYAGIIVIAALGIVISFTLDVIERRVIPWHGSQRRKS